MPTREQLRKQGIKRLRKKELENSMNDKEESQDSKKEKGNLTYTIIGVFYLAMSVGSVYFGVYANNIFLGGLFSIILGYFGLRYLFKKN